MVASMRKTFVFGETESLLSELVQLFCEDKFVKITGKSSNIADVRQKAARGAYDILLMDVEEDDIGIEKFLTEYAKEFSISVIVITKSPQVAHAAYRTGAQTVQKPERNMPEELSRLRREVVFKIKFAHLFKKKQDAPQSVTAHPAALPPPPKIALGKITLATNFKGIIALGASVGGTEATASVLRQLPPNLPGMVIVQHMPPLFTKIYAERLENESELNVREAKSGDQIQPGLVLVAPGNQHLIVVKHAGDYFVECYEGDRVSGHCPSVDVMFDSVAEAAGANAVGIILTGMGSDGAKGITKLHKKGAFTIGQDEKTCVVYGMPKVAFELGGISKQESIENIPKTLIDHLQSKVKFHKD